MARPLIQVNRVVRARGGLGLFWGLEGLGMWPCRVKTENCWCPRGPRLWGWHHIGVLRVRCADSRESATFLRTTECVTQEGVRCAASGSGVQGSGLAPIGIDQCVVFLCCVTPCGCFPPRLGPRPCFPKSNGFKSNGFKSNDFAHLHLIPPRVWVSTQNPRPITLFPDCASAPDSTS